MNGRKVYFTDGTSESFYTAVFDGYNDSAAYITSEKHLQLSLGETHVYVEMDGEKVARVLNKIKRLDARAVLDIEYVLRHNAADKAQTAFLYVRELVKSGRSVRGKLSLSCVQKMMEYRGQVSNEVH